MAEAAVAPIRLRLELDLPAEGETFGGHVAITLAVAREATQIKLDCADLDIEDVKLDDAPAAWRVEGEALIVTPSSPLQPGRAVAAIRYRGRLQAAPRGLYRAGAVLATQLQPMHARRVLPCFDEPRLRCVFELSVWVSQDQVAISNGAVQDEHSSSGRRLVTFAPTPAIPTYLLALAIGGFEKRVDADRHPPIAVHALRAPGRCDFVLRTGREAVAFQSGWLERPYPFDKLDLVVLPRTAVAGMENTAAIFLRESVVALGEDAPLRARADAAALVSHEAAHQWFGGHVTPRDWQDLWLNEGFATWMAAKTLAAIAPELSSDADEVRAMRAALHADFGPGARALVTGGHRQGDIEELFDATAYRKGAALLRMLEAWLGEEAFRRGLQRYLDRHADATAGSADLWHDLGSVCGRQAAEVGRMFAARPGAPHLVIAWQGDTVEVTQVGEALWTVPVHLRVACDDGRQVVKTLLLEGPFARIRLPSRIAWIMGDAGAVGYYRCTYATAGPPIAALSPSEAVVLIEDAWLALWNDEIDLPSYLALMREAIDAGVATACVQAHARELRDLFAGGARAAFFDRWMGNASPGGGAADAASIAKQLALLEDAALDGPARVLVAEELLADPATRHACWTRIKERWDDLGAQLVGLGGRGVIAGLAAFSDPASEKDIADFFAHHEVPGATRTLAATLARIAGRRQFRERHQAAMDAFLLRRAAPAGEVAQRVRVEHALLAAMAAGFRGALIQRSLHDHFGLPAPAWMHTLENLRGAVAAAERQLAALHRGVPVLSPGDVQLAQRLHEDLRAAADAMEKPLRKIKDAGRESFLAVAAGLARCAATVERELEAAVVFSALFDAPQRAQEVRREFADSKAMFAPVRQWIAQAPAGAADLLQRLALQNDAVLAPGMLRLQADRMQGQLAALGFAPAPDPSAAWVAFGFEAGDAGKWREAGFDDARSAASWRLRDFDPGTARRLRGQGADPAALRRHPAAPATPRTRRVVLPDGSAFTVEVADDAAMRVQGLMYRDAIPARGGMLFVHADDRPRPITMRNVRIPLDVVWLLADGTVVHVEQDVPPWHDAPVPQDPQRARSRLVLELPAGSARAHRVEVGTRLALDAP